MSCYYPLLRLEFTKRQKLKQDGTKTNAAQIISYESADFEKYSRIAEGLEQTEGIKVQRIPCGKCIGCRLDYSKAWATRAMLEAQNWKENYFLTLTYDDEHKPYKAETFSKESGEIFTDPGYWNGTLDPTDIQLFMKRLRITWLRRYGAEDIRFMLCGEYGGQTKRPHYHAIMFNFPIRTESLKFYKYNGQHEALYTCEEIEEIWGKGYVIIGEVTWSSCAYVARYVTKKIGLPANQEWYAMQGQEPEFLRVSRKPGIGRAYYEMNKEQLYKFDQLLMKKYNGEPIKVRPPKYYDKLYDLERPEEMEKIKKKREKMAKESEKRKRKQTTLGLKEQWQVEERALTAKTKSLKRAIEV